jgi:hypothetical protein
MRYTRSPPSDFSEVTVSLRLLLQAGQSPVAGVAQPAELAGHLVDRSTPLQHGNEAGLLALGTRPVCRLARFRSARLPLSPRDGGAQHLQGVRLILILLQNPLGGVAGREQLLPGSRSPFDIGRQPRACCLVADNRRLPVVAVDLWRCFRGR